MITGNAPTTCGKCPGAGRDPGRRRPDRRGQRTVQRSITTSGTERIRAPRQDAAQALNAAFDGPQNPGRPAADRRHPARHAAAEQRRADARLGDGRAGTARRHPPYVKNRVWDHAIGSDTMTATFDAYVDGGEEGSVRRRSTIRSARKYGDGGAMFDEWLFTNMDGLEFGPNTGADSTSTPGAGPQSVSACRYWTYIHRAGGGGHLPPSANARSGCRRG